MIIDLAKIYDEKLKNKEIIDCLSYFLNYTIENLMLPGQIENWDCLLDFGGKGFSVAMISVRKIFYVDCEQIT